MNTQKSSTEAESAKLQVTLDTRGATYGDFAEIADLSEGFKKVVSDYLGRTGRRLPAVHQESLMMIFHKIARALAGDPNYVDNWHDIAGYASLVELHIKRMRANATQKLCQEEVQAHLNSDGLRTTVGRSNHQYGQAWGAKDTHIGAVRADQGEAVLAVDRQVQP